MGMYMRARSTTAVVLVLALSAYMLFFMVMNFNRYLAMTFPSLSRGRSRYSDIVHMSKRQSVVQQRRFINELPDDVIEFSFLKDILDNSVGFGSLEVEDTTTELGKAFRLKIAILVHLIDNPPTINALDSGYFVSTILTSVNQTMEQGYDYTIYSCDDSVHMSLKDGNSTHPLFTGTVPPVVLYHCVNSAPINDLTMQAYDDGADYFLLLTDSRHMVTVNWTSEAVAALTNYNPPNVGLACPVTPTKDSITNAPVMLHRTHIDIFGILHPSAMTSAQEINTWLRSVYSHFLTYSIPTWIVKSDTDRTTAVKENNSATDETLQPVDYYKSLVNVHILNSVTTNVSDVSGFKAPPTKVSGLGAIVMLAPPRNLRHTNYSTVSDHSAFCLFLHTVRSIDMYLNAALWKSYTIFVLVAADFSADVSGIDGEYTEDDRQRIREAAAYSNIRFIEINLYTKDFAGPSTGETQWLKWIKGQAGKRAYPSIRQRSEWRLWSGRVQLLPMVRKFKYYMRIDYSGRLVQPLQKDPFKEMETFNLHYAYVHQYDNLTSIKALKASSFYVDAVSGNAFADTRFHIARTSIFLSKRWRAFWRVLEKSKVFHKVKITDYIIHKVLIDIFVGEKSVHQFHWLHYHSYFNHVAHGESSKLDITCNLLNNSIHNNVVRKSAICVKVIMGIFITKTEDYRIEQWRSLLNIKEKLTFLTCGLNFVFVLVSSEMNMAGHTGLVSLKSSQEHIDWLAYALHHYSKADFIGKLDSDTQICPSELYKQILASRNSAYIGRQACFEKDPFKRHCPPFIYHESDLYVLSSKMATEVVYHQSFLKGSMGPHAGVMIGYLVSLLEGTNKLYYLVNDISRPSLLADQGDNASMNFLPTCTNDSYISNVPRTVWTFWFGRPMQGKRLEAWKSLKANIGVPIILVTQETLSNYNISEHPMHPALSLERGLSMNHKSDYLRVYFMHHYGGGYHDIKPRTESWKYSFDVFENPDIWVHGITERGPEDIGCQEDYAEDVPACKEMKTVSNHSLCCKEVVQAWESLVSNVAYIARPNTSLTYEWLRNVERHLTENFEKIKLHPAPKPRCCQLGEPHYPLRWGEVHGNAFHPLQWKYNQHILHGLSKWDAGKYSDAASESSVYNAPTKA